MHDLALTFIMTNYAYHMPISDYVYHMTCSSSERPLNSTPLIYHMTRPSTFYLADKIAVLLTMERYVDVTPEYLVSEYEAGEAHRKHMKEM